MPTAAGVDRLASRVAKLWKAGRVTQWLVTLPFLCSVVYFKVSAANSPEAPLHRSFFLLNESLATQIKSRTQVQVKPGLYFTKPEDALFAPEFYGSSYESKLKSDASYLLSDDFNAYLYENGWKTRGLRRILRKGDKVDSVQTLLPSEEFAVDIGWVDRQGSRQLWLSRANERWLLYDEDENRFNLFLSVPKYFFPLGTSVIAFTEGWTLVRKFYPEFEKGVLRSRFSLIPYGGTEALAKKVEFTIATTQPKKSSRRYPIWLYNANLQQALFAGWSSEAADYRRARGKILKRDRQTASLFWWNLRTGEIKKLYEKISWPFLLSQKALYQLKEGKLRSRAIQWGVEGKRFRFEKWKPARINYNSKTHRIDEFLTSGITLASRTGATPLSNPQYLVQVTEDRSSENEFKPVPNDSLKKMEEWGFPPDLLTDARLGKSFPAQVPQVFPNAWNRLKRALNNPQRTWALIEYEKGDRPVSLVSSLLQAMEVGMTPTPPNLEPLDNLFLFRPELFFGRYPVVKGLEEALSGLAEAVSGRRAVVFFHDFPSDNASAFSGDVGLDELLDRLKLFNDKFGDCMDKGQCRVIMSMRAELHKRLGRSEAGRRILGSATVIQPDPKDFQRNWRQRSVGLYNKKYEQAFSIDMESKALARVQSLLVPEGNKINRKRPGNYDQWFLDLYSSIHLKGKRTITPFMVDDFERRRTRRPILQELPYKRGKEKGTTWFWVVEGQPSQESAVNPEHHAVLKKEPKRLLWSTRFSHALLGIPKAYTQDKKTDSLHLLMPPDLQFQVLDFIPKYDQVALHPKGFYFVVHDEKNVFLAFCNVSRVSEPTDKPEIQFLKPTMKEAPLRFGDYKDGKIRFRFENDQAIYSEPESGIIEFYEPSGKVEGRKEKKE